MTVGNFKTYVEANKANLNKEALAKADPNEIFQEFKKTGVINQSYFNPAPTPTPKTPVIDTASLGAKIKTGDFTASERADYNKATNNKQGARDLALTSQPAVENLQTTVSPEEGAMIKQAGVDISNTGIKADLTGTNQENYTKDYEEALKTPQAPKIQEPQAPKNQEPQTTDFTKIQSVEDWKKQTGGGMNNLESWVEKSYGTVATQNPDGTLTAKIGDKDYKWTIDGAGNPIKEEISGEITNPQVDFAKNNNIQYDIDSLGNINFKPSDFKQTFDLLNSGLIDKTKLDLNDPNIFGGIALFNKFTKYKGASVQNLLYGINNKEIAPGGETWDYLTKINGGVETPEMIEAKKQYNLKTGADNINNSALVEYNLFNGQETALTDNSSELTKITDKFLSTMTSNFSNLDKMYAEYEKGDEDLLNRNSELTKLNADYQSLEDERNRLNKEVGQNAGTFNSPEDIRKRMRIDDINEELLIKGREYNTKLSDYNAKQTLATKKFENNVSRLGSKMGLIQNMYQIRQGNIIRQEDIERQDKLLADERIYKEEQYNKAIERQDEQIAIQFANELKLLDKKEEYNKQVANQLQFFNLGGGAIAKANPTTGEISFESIGTTGTTGTTGATGNVDISSVLDIISDNEGTHGNYNAMYGKGGQTAINLTNMTLKQIQDLQQKSIYKDKNGNYVGGAIGKYQIVSGTLNGLVKRMGLTGNEKFTPELQDKMAMNLIGDSWNKYQNGDITPQQFQKKIAGIWAGVPDPTTGKSVYTGDGTNKASSSNAMATLLAGGQNTTTFSKTSSPIIADAAKMIFAGANINKITKANGQDYANQVKSVIQDYDNYARNNRFISLFNTVKTGGNSETSDTEQAGLIKAAVNKDEKAIRTIMKAKLSKEYTNDGLGNIENNNKTIIKINDTLKDLEKSGKTTGFLPALGEAVVKKAGTTNATELAKLNTIIGQELASFIKETSGAAVSDSERKVLTNLMGNSKLTPNTLRTVIGTFFDTRLQKATSGVLQSYSDYTPEIEQLYRLSSIRNNLANFTKGRLAHSGVKPNTTTNGLINEIKNKTNFNLVF